MSEGKYVGWRKASYSDSSGNCVEVASSANWRKSSHSNDSGNCVEVRGLDRVVGVRDSKEHGRGPVLELSAAAWRKFLAEVKSGTRDL